MMKHNYQLIYPYWAKLSFIDPYLKEKEKTEENRMFKTIGNNPKIWLY